MTIPTCEKPARQSLGKVRRSYAHYYEDNFTVLQVRHHFSLRLSNGLGAGKMKAHFDCAKVENVLYRLPAALLTRRSQAFAALFSLPRSVNSVRCTEGLLDDEPIILHGHVSADFDCLMDYLFGSASSGPPSTSSIERSPGLSYLMSLLKMSDFFDIADGRSYALLKMESHPGLDLASKLLICLQYNVVPWLAPAFRDLVALPLHHHNLAELGKIPDKILHSLLAVKHLITNHRLTLAAVPPPVINGFNCTTPATCGYSWGEAWVHGPAEMFRHPDVEFTGREVLAALEAAEIRGICNGCRDLSVSNVKDSGSLLAEEQFVEDMIVELTVWLTSL
ncbi:hypothetical protein BDN67DRAFT_972438 [Paxillus ammoniavirescens]|nr:hypothetical protein BDN67DRAFT_972438 [Paxillus ammoniavirescens]